MIVLYILLAVGGFVLLTWGAVIHSLARANFDYDAYFGWGDE